MSQRVAILVFHVNAQKRASHAEETLIISQTNDMLYGCHSASLINHLSACLKRNVERASITGIEATNRLNTMKFHSLRLICLLILSIYLANSRDEGRVPKMSLFPEGLSQQLGDKLNIRPFASVLLLMQSSIWFVLTSIDISQTRICFLSL